MKFLADVNIPQSVISYLVSQSHDVLDFKKVNLSASDREIVESAQKEKRIIITLDKDFISLTQFPKYKVACIVIRLKYQNPKQMINYLGQLLTHQKIEILKKSLTIIRENTAESHALNKAF